MLWRAEVMRKPKPKIHKHLAFDSDIFERAEKEAKAENKSLNEWMNDSARAKIQSIDKAKEQSEPQTQTQTQPQPHEHMTLSADEAERIIRDQIIPSIENCPSSILLQDKDSVPPLLRSARILVETINIKLGRSRKLKLGEIPYTNPFEQARQEGIKKTREIREKNERVELMSALPQPIEVMEEIDIDTDIETSTNASVATDALTTSSTIYPHLTEAEFLALKRQQEARDKRLEKYSKEIAAKMRAQAKDSVKLVDESKEVPIEDDKDIPISPADGNEGVLEDDSEKVPQEEF
jgi:hypothetical protein